VKPQKSKRGQRGKTYHLFTDSGGGVPLPDGVAPGVRIGDIYAVWEIAGGWMIKFPKTAAARKRIPTTAHWGKVEPALREVAILPPIADAPGSARPRRAKPAAKSPKSKPESVVLEKRGAYTVGVSQRRVSAATLAKALTEFP